MEIANVSSALSAVSVAGGTNTLAGAVGMKMLDNTLETNEALNASMIKMMENSVTPHIGGNFDMSV
ncbi:MAG: YjfB family protein [Agathobacter sp.]|nr:YjfB family protein [Agathobacter sp.]